MNILMRTLVHNTCYMLSRAITNQLPCTLFHFAVFCRIVKPRAKLQSHVRRKRFVIANSLTLMS